MSVPCPPGKQLDRHCADGEDEVGECMTHDQLRSSVLEVKLSGASVLSIGLLFCPISHPFPNNNKKKQFVLPAHEQTMAPFGAEQDLLLTVLCIPQMPIYRPTYVGPLEASYQGYYMCHALHNIPSRVHH